MEASTSRTYNSGSCSLSKYKAGLACSKEHKYSRSPLLRMRGWPLPRMNGLTVWPYSRCSRKTSYTVLSEQRASLDISRMVFRCSYRQTTMLLRNSGVVNGAISDHSGLSVSLLGMPDCDRV